VKIQQLSADDQRGILITWSKAAKRTFLTGLRMAFHMGVYFVVYRAIYWGLHQVIH
jgi:hypothetical protein